MIKDIIGCDGIEYQLSTVYFEDTGIHETMIFPIINGVVSGEEVYAFRTLDSQESQKKHADAYYNPVKYLSTEAIDKYLKSKEELLGNEQIREKFKEEDFTEDELTLLKLAFKLVDDVVETQRIFDSDAYICTYMSNELYNLKEKLGISELLK